MKQARTAAALLWSLAVMPAIAQTVSIESENGTFVVRGAALAAEPPDGWGSVFRVYAGAEETQPVLGSYAVNDGALMFRPRFPRPAKVEYRAVFRQAGGDPVTAVFRAEAAAAASTRVVQVYPSGDVLPGNVLKLYLVFSAPMSRGEVWQRLHLLDEAGQPVKLAFLEIEQELWDPGNRRLTVLFDPGRIKRGLVPANELGTPIVEGRRYTLVIDREWRDAQGVGLAEGFRKEFRGGAVDRDPPDPLRWKVTAPKAGTREPLVVDFGKAMDFALAQRLLEVPGVAGEVAMARNEREWRLTPASAWAAGEYRLVADPALEDVAGNRLNRAFDVDLSVKTERGAAGVPVTLRFTVR